MKHYILENLDLIYQYIKEEDIIEQFIFENFGLKGGKLIINDKKEVQVHIVSEDGIKIVTKMWIPFETIVKHSSKFDLMVFNHNNTDYITFSLNIKDAPDSLKAAVDEFLNENSNEGC